MASAAGPLVEPRVLAHAKRELFPDDADGSGYAVSDTQFATDRWLDDRRIDPEIGETLAPFNHVRVGGGYPDLVGVGHLEEELLAVDRIGEEPPLVAIEAKGYSADGSVDVERGIVQAYDRLHEANAAYLTAPASAITQSARTLARELNVGVLGVESGGTVTPLEVPRAVGNRTTTETTAIRFQASAQGVANKSFGLNHPKNYLAYPLAVYHPHDTGTVVRRRVVGAVEDARRGASFLGLVNRLPRGAQLTPMGREVVRFARREYGSVDAALEQFGEWKGSRKRFCEIAPKWGLLARRVVWAYPATKLLVEELQHMHEDGIQSPRLIELVQYLHELHPAFAVELFLRGTEEARAEALGPDGELRPEPLADGDMYHSPTVFQLKAILFHAGALTERGAEPSNLDPEADVWKLRTPV
ncbi:MAG: hypothetical protein V5A46_10185 [Haloferacaceae archaeon]